MSVFKAAPLVNRQILQRLEQIRDTNQEERVVGRWETAGESKRERKESSRSRDNITESEHWREQRARETERAREREQERQRKSKRDGEKEGEREETIEAKTSNVDVLTLEYEMRFEVETMQAL